MGIWCHRIGLDQPGMGSTYLGPAHLDPKGSPQFTSQLHALSLLRPGDGHPDPRKSPTHLGGVQWSWISQPPGTHQFALVLP
jgi:hypothetical protein